jgi:hypothetical protein
MTQVWDDINIDEGFAAMLEPLSAEERQQLEELIVEHGGARDPLVVWAKAGTLTLIDGHNRYEICTRLGLPFDIHELRFKSRSDVEDWIDKNQLGRRNLDERHKSLLRGRRYNRTKNKPGRPNKSDQSDRISAAEVAAEHDGSALFCELSRDHDCLEDLATGQRILLQTLARLNGTHCVALLRHGLFSMSKPIDTANDIISATIYFDAGTKSVVLDGSEWREFAVAWTFNAKQAIDTVLRPKIAD